MYMIWAAQKGKTEKRTFSTFASSMNVDIDLFLTNKTINNIHQGTVGSLNVKPTSSKPLEEQDVIIEQGKKNP